MPNGFHSHYCPRCKKQKDCAQVTHCRRSPTALCADCAYDDYVAETKDDSPDPVHRALVEALRLSRSAIKSLPNEALGQDPQHGHFYKDELLAHIEAALAKGERK